MKEKINPNTNKLAVLHVLGSLMSKPLIFADTKYNFSKDLFPEQFHQIVFGAIDHLARPSMGDGLLKIDPVDIDQFLQQYPALYKVFAANNGVEYLQKCAEICDPDKFGYYYDTLNKFALINMYNEQGIDTSDIYNPLITDPGEYNEMQTKFDKMTVNEIALHQEAKMIQINKKFVMSNCRSDHLIGDNIDELMDELDSHPICGLPSMSAKLTNLFRGFRTGCLYLMSAPSGLGKTRIAVGEACHLAFPEYYDTTTKQWVVTGMHESILLIETELELPEVQTMVVGYLSGVQEYRILDGNYTAQCSPDERERIKHARQLMKDAKFHVVCISNYNGTELINIIKEYNQMHGVKYAFYDYLSENMKLMAEGASRSKVSGLRTDQILLQLITDLKDLARQIDIFIWAATQIAASTDYKNTLELDASIIRSCKALADKADVGCILTAVRAVDQPVIDAYCSKGFEIIPDFVLHIYKIRRGNQQNVRVFFKFERGLCRLIDTFVTNTKGEFVQVNDLNAVVSYESIEEESWEDNNTQQNEEEADAIFADFDWEKDLC